MRLWKVEFDSKASISHIKIWVSAKRIRFIVTNFSGKNFHSKNREKVEDQKEETTVGRKAGQDV
jgi:hypothetical protein